MTDKDKALDAANEICNFFFKEIGVCSTFDREEITTIIRKHMQPSVPVSELRMAMEQPPELFTAILCGLIARAEKDSKPEPKT